MPLWRCLSISCAALLVSSASAWSLHRTAALDAANDKLSDDERERRDREASKADDSMKEKTWETKYHELDRNHVAMEQNVFLLLDRLRLCGGEEAVTEAMEHMKLEHIKSDHVVLKQEPLEDMSEGAADSANEAEEATNKGDKVRKKMMKADTEKIARKEWRDVKDAFFPGLTLGHTTWITALVSIGLGVLWFLVYFKIIYRSDFATVTSDWEEQLEAQLKRTGTPRSALSQHSDAQPDLILVFHHPDYEYPDKDAEVTSDVFDRILVESVKSKEAKNSGDAHLHLLQVEDMRAKVIKNLRTPRHDHASSTVRSTRIALITDVYRCLFALGFEVEIFSSIDNDELFMCISLHDPTFTEKYFQQNHVKLQVRQNLVKKLDIAQDPSTIESSPPYIPYDKKLVYRLHQAGVLEENDPRLLYHLTDRASGDHQPRLANSLQRARIIYKEIQHHLDLDAVQAAGLIVDWYPVHDRQWVAELRETWSGYASLKDFTFVQPVNILYQYFGARVAFNMAWNGFYCKALLALMVIAALAEFAVLFAQNIQEVSSEDATIMMKKQIMAFSIIVIIWSRITANKWLREEEFGCALWQVHSITPLPRAQFIGELQPSPANSNKMEKQYPPWKAMLRWLTSAGVTAFFCGLVFVTVATWMHVFKGNLSLTATVMLAVQIKIFEFFWNWMAPVLTSFENLPNQQLYYNSLLWKQFIFQAINSYTFVLYIAVKQKNSEEGCPAGGCLEYLRVRLAIALTILAVFRIIQMIVESLIVKIGLAWELHQLRKAGEEPPERTCEEEQAKYGEFTDESQIENMIQLMLGLGFVNLFAAIAPIVVPFCLFIFVVSLRAQAYSLTEAFQRPIPKASIGIGAWRDVVSAMMQLGVIFNSFLLVTYGDDFQGVPILSRFTAATCFAMTMYLIWGVIDMFEPASGGATSPVAVLAARQHCVQETLTVKAEIQHLTTELRQNRTQSSKHELVAEAISAGQWGGFKHMEEALESHEVASSVPVPSGSQAVYEV